MASNISELEAAKKNISEALGENIKQYWANLKLWFKQKISKEEFDTEARRLLSQDNVHFHNDFLLAILTRCQIMVSVPEGAGSLPWAGGSACKPGKPKGKKKFSSVRQKFDATVLWIRPINTNILDFTISVTKRTVEWTFGKAFCLCIFTSSYNYSTTAAVSYTDNIHPLPQPQAHLRQISVARRRTSSSLWVSQVCRQTRLPRARSQRPLLPPSASLPPGPPPQVSPDEAEQQAALLLACSGDRLPAAPPPVSMFDLLEALQAVPSHTVYALNVERILARLWHPSHKELEQDHVHRQRLAAKEGLVLS
ncbi:UNVERIFIED_CONTAM: hypothetical protein FKN15_066602 [Acipenser sinensis]